MKLSRNVIFVKETQNKYLAVCTLTKAAIYLDEQGKKDLEKGSRSECLKLKEKDFQGCIDMGFLVPDDLNEENYLSYILHKDRLFPLALTTYVAFSTVCNFRCVYCYEMGQVSDQTMDGNTVNLLLDWYKTKLENGHFEICSVDLYGGEPLLFIDMVLNFLTRLREITDTLGVKLDVRLVTNGYLLTQGITKKLYNSGLSEIHITLDGPKKIHNQRRPLKNREGTFQKIFDNMLGVASLDLPLDLVCRISFDQSNVREIPTLLEHIKEKDPKNKIYPYFGSITQSTSQISSSESFCSRHVLEDEEIVKNIVFLYREARKIGFEPPDFFKLGPCMAIADEACVVGPDGLIYKCLDMIGHKELSTGNISLKQNSPAYYDFMRAEQLNRCLKTDCPFVPVCGGGCMMEAYLKTRDYQKSVCHRKMLEEIYQELLPIQFL